MYLCLFACVFLWTDISQWIFHLSIIGYVGKMNLKRTILMWFGLTLLLDLFLNLHVKDVFLWSTCFLFSRSSCTKPLPNLEVVSAQVHDLATHPSFDQSMYAEISSWLQKGKHSSHHVVSGISKFQPEGKKKHLIRERQGFGFKHL